MDAGQLVKGYKSVKENFCNFFYTSSIQHKMRFQEDLVYIESTLNGDMNAFGQLIQKHEKYAFTLALRIMKNPEEAEEVAQDAFMKVYHSLNTFEKKSKFTTWLYKIIYNEALGRLRKSKIFNVQLEEIPESEEYQIDFLDGLSSLHLEERSHLIRKALDKLKPSESAILTLFYLKEQAIKEIEEITGFSESQVKILLHRGRKHMLESLKKISNQELINLL